MGSHDAGLTLIEALEAYTDPGTWGTFEDHLQEVSPSLFPKLPSDSKTAWLLTKLGGKLAEKLRAGEIFTTAYEMPVIINDPRRLIYRDNWVFLEPNFHNSTAAGGGLHLVDVRVFSTLEAANLDVSSHLGPKPGQSAMVDELLKMSESGQLSFKYGGLKKTVAHLHKKFPTYEVDTVRTYIQDTYNELKKKKDKESS